MKDIIEMMKEHAEAADEHTPDYGGERTGFCPVSLADWLKLCEETKVPYVPALKAATITKKDYIHFDQPGERQDRLRDALKSVEKAAAEMDGPAMTRFDFCSSIDVKIAMDRGDAEAGHKPEFAQLVLDDPRAYQIMEEYPRAEIPIFVRPWVKAKKHLSHPVEYRVFVRDGRVAGISSYYPQRPLPLNCEHIERVAEMTERLIAAVPTPFQWHNPIFGMPEDLDPDGVHFTADYLITADTGLPVFLEGNPPHEFGGHPCCFRPYRIEGIALKNRNENWI